MQLFLPTVKRCLARLWSLAWLFLSAFLAAKLAWLLLAPVQPTVLQIPVSSTLATLPDELADAAFAAEQAASIVSGEWLLSGLITGQGEDNFAVLIDPQRRSLVARVGDEVLPGVILAAVASNYIEISSQGRVQRIELPSRLGETFSTVEQGPRHLP